MNKLRVIDLLNKIANGEKVPKKIKFRKNTYEYISLANNYVTFINGINTYLIQEDIIYILNEEVERIEDKKIEKLKYIENGDFIDVPSNQELMSKINEIIDKINSMENSNG